MYKPSGNGNPQRRKVPKGTVDKKIPFWTYSELQLSHWLQNALHKNKATFIATENHWFHNTSIINEEFKQQHRIELVTQIRNPFDRFLSNFFFDTHTDSPSYVESNETKELSFIQRLRRYHSCPQKDPPKKPANCSVFTRYNATNDWNMYVRVLTTQFHRDHELTEKDLKIAMREMDKFDFVTVLDMPGNAELWEKRYNTTMKHKRYYAASVYEQTYSAERERNAHFDVEFKEFKKEFERLNHFDYVIYEYAKQLHNKSLATV